MAEENQEKQFVIQKIYVKDVSFETPNSPVIFTQKWEPKIDFNLASNVQTMEDNLFEVGLTVTVTVKLEDKTAYLVEVTQAGVFTITGLDEHELPPMLGSYCPTLLYPFAREVVADLVVKGGFPPMLLAPVNFDAIYTQHVQQGQQAPAGSNALN